MEVKQGAASVRARCRADGGPERRLAAQPCAGAVQRRRRLSRCTDRSAGGCADRHTVSTTRAQACSGLDTAEALPPRCKPWRSRGRRWRGPAARATARPCRLSAMPEARLWISGIPHGREPRRRPQRRWPPPGLEGRVPWVWACSVPEGLAAGAPCRPAIPVAPAHTARRPRRAVCQASGSPSNGRAPGAASTAGSLAPAPSHGGTRAGAAAARPAACPAHGRLHPG